MSKNYNYFPNKTYNKLNMIDNLYIFILIIIFMLYTYVMIGYQSNKKKEYRRINKKYEYITDDENEIYELDPYL